MKPFCFFLAIALMTTSCLKSLDYDLNDNPFDPDYQGGFIIVDEYAHESKNGSNGEECSPIMRFHLDNETMERLKKIDLSDYEVKLNIMLKRTADETGTIQNQLVSSRVLEYYVLDSVYTSKYAYWYLNNPNDMICPEVFLTYRSISVPATPFYTKQLKSQILECFRCGG